jgi:hypothetical protein
MHMGRSQVHTECSSLMHVMSRISQVQKICILILCTSALMKIALNVIMAAI